MKKRNWFVLFLAFFCLTLVPSAQTNAASQKTKALKAYKKFLEKPGIKWSSYYTAPASDVRFAICDVNKDGVKELILTNLNVSHSSGWNRIYTYKKGKVKSLGHFSVALISRNKNYIKDCYSNCGTSIVRYYRLAKSGERKKLLSYSCSDTRPSWVSGQIVKKYSASDHWNYYYHSFKVNGKKASYSKCMKLEKSLQKGAKIKALTYHDNSAVNRAIYLK